MGMRFVIEEDVLVVDKDVFGDMKEHAYNMKCYNGYALGTAIEEDEKVRTIKMTYPLRKEIMSSDEKCNEVLVYRGLYDLTKKDITYGDIMMRYGTIINQ